MAIAEKGVATFTAGTGFWNNSSVGYWDYGDGAFLEQQLATSFTTGTLAAELLDVTLLLAAQTSGASGLTLTLYRDQLGVPGTDLGVTFTGTDLGADFTGADPTTQGAYNYMASPFTLEANTTYWLAAHVQPPAGSSVEFLWFLPDTFGSTSDLGWTAGDSAMKSTYQGQDWANAGIHLHFAVNVIPIPVPEPSSSLLVVTCGAARLLRRRRPRHLRTSPSA